MSKCFLSVDNCMCDVLHVDLISETARTVLLGEHIGGVVTPKQRDDECGLLAGVFIRLKAIKS